MGRPGRSKALPAVISMGPKGDAQTKPIPVPFFKLMGKLLTAFPASKKTAP